MLSSISFETGRRSQTQSSVKTTRWSETANGSLVLSEIGTTAERPTHAEKNLKEFTPALLPSASGELCPLDKDLSWKSGNRTLRISVGSRSGQRGSLIWLVVGRRLTMKRKLKSRYKVPKTKLGLPDLEQAKIAVIVSLRSFESQRSYRHSIDEFVAWYCSTPRLSLNKAVVLRYRLHLEDRHLAAGTINVRLAAVRRLAYEAADTGLLSPDLAAGIRRVKGAKKLGMRIGNWLTVTEARSLWQLPNSDTLKGKRDRAILAILLGCGLRRRELADLT